MIKLQARDFIQQCADLIRRAACELPEDITSALQSAKDREDPGSIAAGTLESILKNIELAHMQQQPLCQDTGLPAFYVSMPAGISTKELSKWIKEAVVQVTDKGLLRPNAVDPVTGKNSGNNLGIAIPVIHFSEWDRDSIRVKCMLKGGGSENVSVQYSLPEPALEAGRDLKGVFSCVLDAVLRAQGKGCAPGVIGVGIGGDRITGMQTAKDQLLRRLDDENSDPELNELEKSLYDTANELGIGPMGLGGRTTVLGIKAGKAHRLPACYFVSVAYMCWACRRAVMEIEVKK